MSASTSYPDPSIAPVLKVSMPLADVLASVDTCHRFSEWSAHYLTSDMPAPQLLRARISHVVHELLTLMSTSDDCATEATLDFCATRDSAELTLRLSCPSSDAHADRVASAVRLARSSDAAHGWHEVLAGRGAGDSSPQAGTRPTDRAVTMLVELAAVAYVTVHLPPTGTASESTRRAPGPILTLDAQFSLAGA